MLKNLIKELRTRNNMTLKAFGESIGVSESAVSSYESGKKKPGQETLEKISQVYDVSREWLMGEVSDVQETTRMVKAAVEIAAPVIAEDAAEAVEEIRGAGKEKKKPELVIESLAGNQISPEEIFAKLPESAEKVYVKPDENKAYWTGGEETGSINLW